MPDAKAQGNFWEPTGGPQNGFLIISLLTHPNGSLFAGGYITGIFRSLDNGDNWQQVNNGLPIVIRYTFAVNSTGHIFVGCYEYGVYRSLNNGNIWTAINNGLAPTVWDLAVNSNDHIFAGTLLFGAFRSTNNGDSWESINNGFPPNRTVYAIAVNPNDQIFASAAVTNDSKIYRSDDNGTTWIPSSNGLPNVPVLGILVTNAGHLYAVTEVNGIYRSIDNGNSWSYFGFSGSIIRSLAVNISGHIFVGIDGQGIFRSLDDGSTWTTINSGLTQPTVYSLAIDAAGRIFAGTVSLPGPGVFRSIHSTVAVEPITEPGIATEYLLSQNYPNPFNPSTTIQFSLPAAQSVTLKVYDNLGREVATLFQNERLAAGTYQSVFEAGDLPSGVYYYRVTAGEFGDAKKMLLLR